MLCEHKKLHFGEGGFYVTCYSCQKQWMAIDHQGQPDRDRCVGLWGIRAAPIYFKHLPAWKKFFFSLFMYPWTYNAKINSRLLSEKK